MGISDIYRDALFRNYVVVTVSFAIDRVRSASDSVDRFINEHFFDDFAESLASLEIGNIFFRFLYFYKNRRRGRK